MAIALVIESQRLLFRDFAAQDAQQARSGNHGAIGGQVNAG